MEQSYREKKEMELENELKSGSPSTERIGEISNSFEWLRMYDKATKKEKYEREQEIGRLMTDLNFTPEQGRSLYMELEIIREGKLSATEYPQG